MILQALLALTSPSTSVPRPSSRAEESKMTQAWYKPRSATKSSDRKHTELAASVDANCRDLKHF